MIRGLVGAVYRDDAAPLTNNLVLLLDWELQIDIQKQPLLGSEMSVVPVGWYVQAHAYFANTDVPKKQATIRLFIGDGEDKRHFIGTVMVPELRVSDTIQRQPVIFRGINQIRLEDKYAE